METDFVQYEPSRGTYGYIEVPASEVQESKNQGTAIYCRACEDLFYASGSEVCFKCQGHKAVR